MASSSSLKTTSLLSWGLLGKSWSYSVVNSRGSSKFPVSILKTQIPSWNQLQVEPFPNGRHALTTTDGHHLWQNNFYFFLYSFHTDGQYTLRMWQCGQLDSFIYKICIHCSSFMENIFSLIKKQTYLENYRFITNIHRKPMVMATLHLLIPHRPSLLNWRNK